MALVSVVCFQVEVITGPEESHRLWCGEEALARLEAQRQIKKMLY